jgi:hypothetical protein
VPLVKAAVPRVLTPSEIVTVPEGVPAADETVVVKVIVDPNGVGFTSEVIAVAVDAGLTICCRLALELDP